jgi:isochorismate pyruvate lyase
MLSQPAELGSLEEVRARIDAVDRELVRLLAERGGYVRQAARFKRSGDEVRAPQRAEAVVARARALAEAHGLDPAIAERVYRAMIAAFVEAELREHARLSVGAGTGTDA